MAACAFKKLLRDHPQIAVPRPAQVALVLGASYPERLDDLAVFNRTLSDAEVKQLFGLEKSVAGLR